MEQLSERLLELCDSVHGDLPPGPARNEVARARGRLLDPLRLALTGRVSAGKSTIVNALLGRRVAPTAAGECTRMVTWYQAKPSDGAEIRLRNGETKMIGLAGGSLPADVGVEHDQVESVRVGLQTVPALNEITVIDTPGLDSGSGDVADVTESFLGLTTRSAVAEADAVIYVFKEPPAAFDERVLEGLRSNLGRLRMSAFNAVGALNMADKLGGTEDAELAAAERVADRYEGVLGSVIDEIVPTVGLLGETAEAELREEDARALRELIGLSADERELMLLSSERFLEADCTVSTKQRKSLLQILDLFGIARTLEWISAGASGAAELRERLLELSGIARLRAYIEQTLARRAGALKAQAALAILQKVAYSPEGSGIKSSSELRGALDDLLLEPTMHTLEEAWALKQVAVRRVVLEEWYADDLRRLTLGARTDERLGLAEGSSAAEQEATIIERADRWKGLAGNGSDQLTRRVADIAWMSYTYLLEEVSSG